MNNGLLAGKAIYNILTENAGYRAICPNTYMLQAPASVKAPYCVFGRETLLPNYVKETAAEDEITYSFYTVASDYVTSVDIANKIRELLEDKEGVKNNVNFLQIKLLTADETIVENFFVQHLTFSVFAC